jgi:cytochrome c-type biogenesis protein CcmE
MNRKHKIKLAGILCLLALLGGAAALVLYALKQNINLFYTPTQLLEAHIQADQSLRIGGYVKMHSVHYDTTGTRVIFTVTDRSHEIMVSYQGVLPNLFREGQTVVVTGKLDPEHHFAANEVLAKHDEKYMPPTLAKELKDPKRHDS